MLRGMKFVEDKRIERDLLRNKLIKAENECDAYNKYQKALKLIKLIWMFYGIFVLLSLVCAVIFPSINKDWFKLTWSIVLIVNLVILLCLFSFLPFYKKKKKQAYDDELKNTLDTIPLLNNASLELAKISLVAYAYSASANYLNTLEKSTQEKILGEISNFYGRLLKDKYKDRITLEEYIDLTEYK